MAWADPKPEIMPWLKTMYLISAVVSFILYIAMQLQANCQNNQNQDHQDTFKVSCSNNEN